jgi:ATP-dependent Clp protease ATP-binding subunit ClpC
VFETFEKSAREAIERAQDEAREMGHGMVGVEHLLLGLVSDQNSTAGRVLAESGLTITSLREVVRERLDPGLNPTSKGQLRFSAEAKDALNSAHRFGLNEPGTEHMLLVLVGRGERGACEILRARGADPAQIRFATKKQAWPSSFAGPGPSVEGRSVRYSGELDFGD